MRTESRKRRQAVESDDLDFMPSAEPEELTSTESDEDYRPPMEDQDLVESEDKMPPSPAACKSRRSLRADDKDKIEKDEGSEIVQESNGLHKEDDEAEDDKEEDENDEKKRDKEEDDDNEEEEDKEDWSESDLDEEPEKYAPLKDFYQLEKAANVFHTLLVMFFSSSARP